VEEAHADVPSLSVAVAGCLVSGLPLGVDRLLLRWLAGLQSQLPLTGFSVHNGTFPNHREKCSLDNLLSRCEARRHHRAANNSPANVEPVAPFYRIRGSLSSSMLCDDLSGGDERCDNARYHEGAVRQVQATSNSNFYQLSA